MKFQIMEEWNEHLEYQSNRSFSSGYVYQQAIWSYVEVNGRQISL